MNNYLSLTKVIFKNSLGLFTDGKSKKGSTTLLWIIVAICMLPLIGSIYYLFKEMFAMFTMIQQEGVIFSIGMQIASVLIFIFSIFLIPSIYYFSKDSATLLALPLSPKTIIASKFTVCIVYEYIFVLLFFIPLLFAYIYSCGISFSVIFWSIIATLTLPIYPLILSSLITILMMSFLPFMKRKDTFTLIGSILMIVVAFAFSFYSNTIDPAATEGILESIMEGNNSLLNIMNYLFPALNFMAKGIINNDLIAVGIYFIIHIIAIVIILFLADKLYFKGVIGVDETGSSRKQFSSKELSNKTKKQNVFFTYLKKEFRILYRTPAYLMNCLLMCIIPGVCLAIPIFAEDMSKISANIPLDLITQMDAFLPVIILSGLIAGYAFANLTMISCTAISREGTGYVFMKYIPVPLKTQINAKVICGILVSLLTTLLTLIPIYILLPFDIIYYVIFFIASLFSNIVGNYIGICLDIVHPKLVWEQEAIAVKQNVNAVIAMFGGIAISVALGFIAFQIPTDMLLMYSLIVAVLTLVAGILCYMYAQKLVIKAFHKM